MRFQFVDKLKIRLLCGVHAAFCFSADRCGGKTPYRRKTAICAVFQGYRGGIVGHSNRLPPVADKKRLLWRRGRRKFALQANIFFGYHKSKGVQSKIFDFCERHPRPRECRLFRHSQIGTGFKKPVPIFHLFIATSLNSTLKLSSGISSESGSPVGATVILYSYSPARPFI